MSEHASANVVALDELRRQLRLLASQTGHWSSQRWAAPAPGDSAKPRADLVYALVQRMADRAADAEGQPRRPVPRLDNDLALLDQLRVMVADLLAAHPDPATVAASAEDIAATRRVL